MPTTTDIETTYLLPPNVDVWEEIIIFVRQPGEEYFFDFIENENENKKNPNINHNNARP